MEEIFFYKGEAAKIIENTFNDGGMINKIT